MILHAALFMISAAGGEGTSCRVDADCMGGLACTTDRVCASLRAPPPREVVREQEAPPPRRAARVYRRSDGYYHEGQAIPEGAHVENRPKLGLIISGAVVLGVWWIIEWTSTIEGCYGCNNAQVPVSFIPVAGPFVQLALLHYNNTGDRVLAPFVVIDGLLQGLGAGLLLGGALTSRKVLVYDAYGVQGTILPMGVPGGGAGLSAMGTF